MDAAGRQEASQITSNFYSLEMYQDALRAVNDRFKQEPRVTPLDLWDPRGEQDTTEPPIRHSLQRRLDDFLLLIVRNSASGKWTVPSEERAPSETLRMTVDRAIRTQHGDMFDAYIWSNSPSGVIKMPSTGGGAEKMFVYGATYLSGKPRFDESNTTLKDHAWVTRRELQQYRGLFEDGVLEVLFDIAPIGGAVEHN